jgi:hypothetical protein
MVSDLKLHSFHRASVSGLGMDLLFSVYFE